MEVKKIEIETSTLELSEHTLYTQESSKGILVVFPGGNSSCNAPIIQYVETGLFNDSFDILEISYNKLVERGTENVVENLCDEVEKALTLVCEKHENILFLSRSFGNVISTRIRIESNFKINTQVFLAPIPDAIENIKTLGGLVIAGDHDSYISIEKLRELENIDNIELNIIEGANHSLESDVSVEQSIDFAKEIVLKTLNELKN